MQRLEVPELKRGVVVWTSWGSVDGYIIQGVEHGPDCVVLHTLEVNTQRPRKLYPGDLGHPDHVYDNRPCCMYTNMTDANERRHLYGEWLQNKAVFALKYPELSSLKKPKFVPDPAKRGFDLMLGRTVKSVDTSSINVVTITFTDGVKVSIDTEAGPVGIPVVVAYT